MNKFVDIATSLKPTQIILPTIVISQFLCTSLWFAGNAVMGDMVTEFGLAENVLGHLTSAVQFGFIIGTLTFALLSIADRFSPSKVFAVCAFLGACFNILALMGEGALTLILLSRFFTGFFLAGIYPVGMKIAADHFDKGLGKSLGFLVGALTLGTAFPHLLREFLTAWPWQWVLYGTSILAGIGGLAMLLMVPDGPFRKPSQKLDLTAIFRIFKSAKFRSPAFGYFGHMWELYAFWAFVPVILGRFVEGNPHIEINIPLFSFIIIGIGGFACVISGYLAQRNGERKVAAAALFLSGLCCLAFPFVFGLESRSVLLLFMIFWGMVVIADSPLFSTLVAKNAPVELKGTALTIVNCIGFMLTIISIQVLGTLSSMFSTQAIFMVLASGPVLGLIVFLRKG